jgi:hypothetical protein
MTPFWYPIEKDPDCIVDQSIDVGSRHPDLDLVDVELVVAMIVAPLPMNESTNASRCDISDSILDETSRAGWPITPSTICTHPDVGN